MLRIILITMGAMVFLLMLLCCYSALVVASREDERMEQYDLEQQMKSEQVSAPEEGGGT